jgi:hypothetical protein
MGKPSLDEFAGVPGRRKGESYLDSLPDDIQTQLIESKAGHTDAYRWLRSLGYTEAGRKMVENWRNARGWTL